MSLDQLIIHALYVSVWNPDDLHLLLVSSAPDRFGSNKTNAWLRSYSTTVKITTVTLDNVEVSVGALSTTTIVSPLETKTVSSTYVTTVPGPDATKSSSSGMSTMTVTATGSATKTATSTAGAATLGAHGLIGLAAGVLAFI